MNHDNTHPANSQLFRYGPFRNYEGYYDPTAGNVIKLIEREERAARRAALKPRFRFMPKVYICSPFAGDTDGNIAKARRYCAFAVKKGYIPYASHLFFPQFLSDDIPVQRELGLFMGMVYLDGCKECWVFGNTVSSGMAAEIERAKKRGITLRYFTEQCEEVTG